MIFYAVMYAQAVGCKLAEEEAKRRVARDEQPTPEPQSSSPTLGDRAAEFLFWLAVFLPGILIASAATVLLYAIIKVAFAAQGQSFP